MMGQTLIQRNRTSEAHKLLTSLPLMSFSDFPFLIGFRLLYGSVDGLDEHNDLKVTVFFIVQSCFFSSIFPSPKSFFFSVQRKLKQFLFFLEARWVFQWSGHWFTTVYSKRIQLPSQTKWWSRWSFSSSRRCQTGESHSNCRVFFWGRQLRDF